VTKKKVFFVPRFISFFLKLGYGGIQLINEERIRIQVKQSTDPG
jgi:hypothetical protein